MASCPLLSCSLSLMKTFDGKIQDYIREVEDVHFVWLEEIQQEAKRMFSSDFSAEPELMPKTPVQKKSNRRKRISVGKEESRRRRSSKGKRNQRISSVRKLNLISEDEVVPVAVSSEFSSEELKRSTRCNKPKQRSSSTAADTTRQSDQAVLLEDKSITDKHENSSLMQTEAEVVDISSHPPPSNTPPSPPATHTPEVTVSISAADRMSAEILLKAESSPTRSTVKIAIAATGASSSRRSSVRRSLTLRRSLAGLRQSMNQAAVRRASRRSYLKKQARRSNRNVSEDDVMLSSDEDVVDKTEGVLSDVPEPVETQTGTTETSPEEEKKLQVLHARLTRSMAQNPPSSQSSAASSKTGTPDSSDDHRENPQSQSSLRPRSNSKRRAADTAEDHQSPRKKPSPKRSHTAIRPNMRSFLQTVQKNQLLMMTPSSLSRSTMMKSFIKHTTPHKVDLAKKEQLKLETLKKKQEQEEERRRKMEEDKKKRLEELKKKRDERLRKVVEARMKEEEEKLKMRKEKNDKAQQREERLAEEKTRKMAAKRQEELEQRRKLEEETRRRQIQQAEEEEKCMQEMQAKRRAEEEQERTRKLAEARRAIELKKEQELERERELARKREAAERERVEQEKALALKREVEKAAREKERRELEEKRRELEEKRKREALAEEERAAKLWEAAKQQEAASAKHTSQVQPVAMKTPLRTGPGLNVTVDMEGSPQSYAITPKGGNKPAAGNSNAEDYGMDQKSDDSTDDESAPRKPIPSWAEGINLKQSTMKQYFNPLDLHTYFGEVELLKLENIFYKSKPRYFKRTSSAVWNSPPKRGNLPF